MKSESDYLMADQWGRAFPVERPDIPVPFLRHLGRGNGLHPLHHIPLGEQVTAQPGRIQTIAHLVDLVPPHLKRGNPAPHDGAQHVIAVEFLLNQLLQDLVDSSGLVGLGWAVLEILLGYGGGRLNSGRLRAS